MCCVLLGCVCLYSTVYTCRAHVPACLHCTFAVHICCEYTAYLLCTSAAVILELPVRFGLAFTPCTRAVHSTERISALCTSTLHICYTYPSCMSSVPMRFQYCNCYSYLLLVLAVYICRAHPPSMSAAYCCARFAVYICGTYQLNTSNIRTLAGGGSFINF